MILVLDTDVLVAGFRSPAGASAELVRLARRGQFGFAVSVALALEYEAVLTRPEHLETMDRDSAFVTGLLDTLFGIAVPSHIDFKYRPQTNDPDDEMVLEAAINAGADAIVTFNRRHFRAATRFGIDCWLPAEALEKIR